FEDGNSAAAGDIAWSLDGNQLLFTADRSPQWREHVETSALFRITLEDGSIERLTPELGRAVRPALSRDGRRLAYLGVESVEDAPLCLLQVFLIELPTGERRCLSAPVERALGTTHTGEVDMGPIWQADGEALFTLLCDGGSTNLVRMDLAGTVSEVTSGRRTV